MKHDFWTYIWWYTSTIENFEHGYSDALLQFCPKLERCKPHKATWHPRKCDKINNVKLFLTVYHSAYCRKFLMLSNQTQRYKSTCIRITYCLLVPSAYNICKQFGPRSHPTKCRAWSGSKLFDTLTVFLNEFFEKVDFKKKLADNKLKKACKNYPVCKELKWKCSESLPCNIITLTSTLANVPKSWFLDIQILKLACPQNSICRKLFSQNLYKTQTFV